MPESDLQPPAPTLIRKTSVVLQLTLLVAATLTILLGALLIIGYFEGRRAFREQIRDRLSAVAESRRDFVAEWVGRQRDRVDIFAMRGVLRVFLGKYVNGEEDEPQRTHSQDNLDRHVSDQAALAARIVTLEGIVLLSNDPSEVGRDLSADPVFRAGLLAPSVGLPERVGERFVAHLAAPSRRVDETQATVGVVMLTVDVTPLAESLHDTTGLGQTGEVLLGVQANGRIQYLFPPRFREIGAVPIANVPAMTAATEGREVLRHSVDYRREPVLAVGRPIGYDGWGLVVKMDEREAEAPVERARNTALLLAMGIGALGLAGAYSVARGFTRPLRRLGRAAESVARGDLSVSVAVRSKNEFGTLSTAFNDMVAALRVRTAEREQAEAALNAERLRLRTLLDVMPAFAYVKDAASRFVVVNEPCARVMGVGTTQELIGRTDADFYPPRVAADFRADEERVLAGEPVIDKEEPLVLPDGTKRIVLTTKVPLRDGDGKIVGLVGIGRDITERKRAESAIRESEELLRSIVDHTEDIIFVKDRESRTIFMNPAGLRANALPPKKLLGHTDAEFVAEPAQAAKFLADDRRVMESRTTETLEEILTSATGERHVLLTTKTPRYDADGNVIGIVGVARDITEQKAAESALRESEQRLRTIIEAEPECVKIVSPTGQLLEMNAAGLAMLDAATLADLSGQSLLSFIAPEHRSAFRDLHRQVMSGCAGTLVFETIGIKGTRRWLETHAVPLRDSGGQVTSLLGVTRDITSRVRAEAVVRESEERYRLLADHTEDIVMLNDTHGNRLYVSPSFYRKTGWSQEELLSTDWRLRVHPDDLAQVEATRAANLAGEFTVIEHRTRCRDGSWIWCETSCKPIADPDGKVWRLLVWAHDITERKRAEAEIRASLHEKEVLLQEVHHRVKNNLQIVSSLLNLQSRELTDPALIEVFSSTRDRVRAMAAVHERLYESGDFARIDLASHLASLVRVLMRAHAPAGSRVEPLLRLEPVPVDLNTAVPLSLIANELILNALKYAFAGPRNGTLSLDLRMVEAHCELRVADDGPGFPTTIDPATTRTLGLRLVRDLARQIHAELRIDSSSPGTSITLRWPARPADKKQTTPADEPAPPQT